MARALRGVMRRLGLAFGAFDLRLTPEGEYVFLEVNPSGQFLFLELAREEHRERRDKPAWRRR